jgi:hypothetical protein
MGLPLLKVGGAAVPRDGRRRRRTAVLVSVERGEIKEKRKFIWDMWVIHVSLIDLEGTWPP